MPPQTNRSQPSQFDFILQDPQKSGGRFKLRKPAFILIGLIVILFLIVILNAVLGSKRSGNGAQILDLAQQDQEIIRVIGLNPNNFTDPNDRALSNTIVVTLTSQQAQFTSTLSKIGFKYTPDQLSGHTNSGTDNSLKTAISNNNFDNALNNYLKGALQKYQASIVSVSKVSSASFDKVLNSAYASNQILLNAPEFATLANS